MLYPQKLNRVRNKLWKINFSGPDHVKKGNFNTRKKLKAFLNDSWSLKEKLRVQSPFSLCLKHLWSSLIVCTYCVHMVQRVDCIYYCTYRMGRAHSDISTSDICISYEPFGLFYLFLFINTWYFCTSLYSHSRSNNWASSDGPRISVFSSLSPV